MFRDYIFNYAAIFACRGDVPFRAGWLGSSIYDQLAVGQTLSSHPRCELRNAAVKMLFRHVMEHSAMRSLETRPEAFDAVGMRHAADVSGDQVVDGRMGVFRPGLGMVADETLQLLL